jgi:hypothetical protein
MIRNNFIVDYMYRQSGSAARRTIQGNSLINLQTATSDFAVYEYIKKLHPQSEINIVSIKWS